MNFYYAMLIFVPTFLAKLNDKYTRNSNQFNFIGMIFLIILITFRKNIGLDYITYKNIYYGIDSGLSRMDLGYRWINNMLRSFNMPFSALLFVMAVFNVGVFYYVLRKYDIKERWFAVFLYLGIFDIFIYSLASMRQTLAISFFMLASVLIVEGKYFKGYAMIIIGALFHWSILIMVPVFYLMGKVKRVNTCILMCLIVVLPFAYQRLMSSPILSMLSSFNYSMEFHLSIENYQTMTNMTNVILNVVICLAWVFIITYVKGVRTGGVIEFEKFSLLHDSTNLDMMDWGVLLFLMTRSCLAIQYNGAIPRIQMYLYFMLPFVVVKKLEIVNPRLRAFIMIAIILLVIMSTNSSIMGLYEYYGNPGFGIS